MASGSFVECATVAATAVFLLSAWAVLPASAQFFGSSTPVPAPAPAPDALSPSTESGPECSVQLYYNYRSCAPYLTTGSSVTTGGATCCSGLLLANQSGCLCSLGEGGDSLLSLDEVTSIATTVCGFPIGSLLLPGNSSCDALAPFAVMPAPWPVSEDPPSPPAPVAMAPPPSPVVDTTRVGDTTEASSGARLYLPLWKTVHYVAYMGMASFAFALIF